MSVFYRPSDGFVGDVMPFYWEGLFHVFYLKAPLERTRRGAAGTPIAHVVSSDLAHWEEWPDAIGPGAEGEPDDVSAFTGSFIERNGVFHLFYGGFRGRDKPRNICHATSSDLRTWEKDPRNPILRADLRWYEGMGWRDPFPFWNEEVGEYWMLLAARVKDGPPDLRACTGLAVSPDLENWEVRPPLWSPHLYNLAHECPDLFRIGNRWCLVFATHGVTRYRISDSLTGPWIAPANDNFGPFFYASKTASDGERRYIFGWNYTLEGEVDAGLREWGGHMVVQELKFREDGRAAVSPPAGVEALFSRPCPLSFQPILGEWQAEGRYFAPKRTDGFAAAVLGDMPETCRIRLNISCSRDTRACGILLRAKPNLEAYYELRWEPGRQRVVVVRRWPRPFPWEDEVLVERPVEATEGESIELTVHIEGTVLVAYVNDSVALGCRVYDHRSGQLGLFVETGEAKFSDVSLDSA